MVSVQVVKMIKTVSVIGEGRKDDPSRQVTQYWDFDGNMLWQYDEWAERKQRERENARCEAEPEEP